jgi:hypothetical protein
VEAPINREARGCRIARPYVDGSIWRRAFPNLRCGKSRAGCARIDSWPRHGCATACCRIPTSSKP